MNGIVNKIRLVFFSSASFSLGLLRQLYEDPRAELLACFTKSMQMRKRGRIVKESSIVNFCKELQIPCYETEKISQEETEKIKNLKPDAGFAVSYGVLFKEEFFSLFRLGIFNLHFSLLPKYRGASPVQTAILNGEKESGVTLQRINEGLDTGDIVFQKAFSIEKKRSDEVFDLSLKESEGILRQWIDGVSGGGLHYKKQEDEKASFCKKIKKQSGFISANVKIDEAVQKHLAYYLWPKTFFKIKGIMFVLEEIGEIAREETGIKETTLFREGKRLFLSFPQGKIEILKIKLEGKKSLLASDFLNGLNFPLPSSIDLT